MPRLARLRGFRGVVNASFVVWFAFHVPGILGGGYRGEGTPLWYSMICFAAFLYPATIFMTWLRLRSGSLWPCVIQHAAHNCFIQLMWRSAFQTNDLTPWLLGEFGVLLPILSSLMVLALLATAGIPRAGELARGQRRWPVWRWPRRAGTRMKRGRAPERNVQIVGERLLATVKRPGRAAGRSQQPFLVDAIKR